MKVGILKKNRLHHIHVSSFFLGKVTVLGVLCCFALFVCLTLLASFFLPSHLSFKNMYMYMYVSIKKYRNFLRMYLFHPSYGLHFMLVHNIHVHACTCTFLLNK